MEDSGIIALYFARDEAAIRETQAKYGAYLNEVAYRILRDASDAEEIVGDTYLGAWNAMPPSKPDALRHFLARIARNLSFNRLDYRAAKRRAHAEQLLSELDECVPDLRANVEHSVEARELTEALNRFLGSLDDLSCALFVARYWYAKTLREVAADYGLSERQAKYRLSVLRGRLKAQLTEEGIYFE